MQVTLGGVLAPVRQVGFAALRGGLIQQQVFLVHHLLLDKQTTLEDRREDAEVHRQIESLRHIPGLYELLARSIAPGVYGMEDVKKALLLQLIGGATKRKADGGMIRGDIHVLLMGDPGVAKSQLMKQVCSIATRGIYTTGKGSSSSGLTAAVIKDPRTMETSLEGGALVLADKGICCIDEFDKVRGRTALRRDRTGDRGRERRIFDSSIPPLSLATHSLFYLRCLSLSLVPLSLVLLLLSITDCLPLSLCLFSVDGYTELRRGCVCCLCLSLLCLSLFFCLLILCLLLHVSSLLPLVDGRIR